MKLFKQKSGNGTWAPQYIYVLYNLPYIWVTKIGITGYPDHRIRDIRESSPGEDYYLVCVRLFGAYQLEQFLHRMFRPLQVQWEGSGHTERFVSLVILLAVPIIYIIKLLQVLTYPLLLLGFIYGIYYIF